MKGKTATSQIEGYKTKWMHTHTQTHFQLLFCSVVVPNSILSAAGAEGVSVTVQA